MKTLDTQLAALPPDKRRLLEALLRKEQPAAPTPRAPGVSTTAPLSFAQERIWLLDQLEPGSALYNIRLTLSVRGPLDVAALQRSLNAIVARHETLRTTFAICGQQPVQVIAPELTIALPLHDLAADPDRLAALERIEAELALQGFDLERGPLLRACVTRLAPDEHRFLLTLHHSVGDGWSTDILLRELAALYEAEVSGRGAALPALPAQYGDFTRWQRRRLADGVEDRQLRYWREQLADLPRCELPADLPRPAARAIRNERLRATLAPELTERVRALSQRADATPYMTLLAAFQLLVGRLAGQDDVVIGTPIAGRHRAEFEPLIGCFLNNLALRADLRAGRSFRELLRAVRQTCLDAYAHQDTPFERLIDLLQPERDASRTPIFQIFFNMLNFPELRLRVAGLEIERLPSADTGAKFDLTLYLKDSDDGLLLNLVYSADLYSRARMEELLDQYRLLLSQIVAQPDAAIESYSLATPRARTLLPDLAAPIAAPEYPPVAATLERIAAQHAAQVAVTQAGRSWSYAELDRASGQLARALASADLPPQSVIAVTGQSSFGLIAALAATLRSGHVMLPLAATLPPERRRLMLQEAGARLLLDADPLDDQPVAAPRWRIDGATAALLDPPIAIDEARALPTPQPDDPAYVFFTSGSTGTPKAVLGRQRGLAHFLSWQRATFAAGPADRAAQLTGLSFDVVLRDIFLPLTSGATLALPPGDALAPTETLRWLAQERITLLHAVPTLVQTWLALTPTPAALTDLRVTFFAGEPLGDALVSRWRAVAPHTTIVNLYGPTETTLAKAAFVAPDPPQRGVQPIGRALPQTQLAALTSTGQLCGLYEPGELAIRTPFRSLGYLNNAAEQAARFRPNPFARPADPHDLLYFTGDRGRLRADGQIEILGRIDGQIKLRGVRIEPGEIEAALLQHPQVRQAAVTLVDDGAHEPMLAAYVVVGEQRTKEQANKDGVDARSPTPDPRLLTADHRSPITDHPHSFREFLQQRLPAALVPSAFVLLDALPLLPNGKLNRRALPAPEPHSSASVRSATPPRDEIDAVLIGLWESVLGVTQIGIHDDFFDLGGHSLKAALLAARVRESFRVRLPLRTLFQATTVAALADLLTSQEAAPGQTLKVARLLKRLQQMSPEERRAMLHQRRER